MPRAWRRQVPDPRTRLSPFPLRRVDWGAGRKQQVLKGEAMKRSSVVFSVTAMLAVGGCRLVDDDWGGSTPTADNVALAVPASARSALTAGDSTTRSVLLCQQADTYTLTRAVTG